MTVADRPFQRVLIANRGEIAVRIIRACHELGMEAVAIYSDADSLAGHVRAADLVVRIGPAPAAESYLQEAAIVSAAVASGADAVHPGYGFLAERASFAAAVQAAGMTFIGPDPRTIAAIGDKLAARRLAVAADVPIVPGTLEPAPVDRADHVEAMVMAAAQVGYPLLVKAAAGGGGRGMRRVTTASELPGALLAGSREATAAFGDGSVYLEREIRPARHIEVQLLGDSTGRVVAVGERDCSLQRRHQKLVEEAPAPGLTEAERQALHGMAVRLASAAHLTNAATAEFLRDPDGRYWFLEVNTRLQVEHGVTELVSGLDLVREQFWLAAGAPLSAAALAAADGAAEPGRHAIEVRLSAEDPAQAFAPRPGRVSRWGMSGGPGVRVDSAIEAGERIPPEYDPLIAKLMVVAGDRPSAIDRLRRALDETDIGGLQTTLPFARFVARDASFRAGALSTDWVADHWDGSVERAGAVHRALLAVGLAIAAESPSEPLRAMGSGAVRVSVAATSRLADDPSLVLSPDSPPAGVRLESLGGGHALLIEGEPVDPGSAATSASAAQDGQTQDGPAQDGQTQDTPAATEPQAWVRTRIVLGPARRRASDGILVREVLVDGWQIEVEIESARRAALRERAQRGRGSVRAHGVTEVQAIIPGRIVAISVAVGDTVEIGQQLLVLEAMKMQNEVRATRQGTIERIPVAVGERVELGDLLVVLA